MSSPLDRSLRDRLTAVAEAAADKAASVIRPLFRTRLDAALKSDQSPVTIADRKAEEVMRRLIADAFPDHGILGEEYGLERAEADFRWVLDPIDGTRAFITGRPTFGTLIGLMWRGEPVLGLIDQPVTGERWIGERALTSDDVVHPTYFTGPFGGQVGIRPCPRLEDAELSATSPEMFGDDLPRWQSFAHHARRVSWGGDCYAYGLLALGQIDIVAEADLKVWDWAALLPVVEGAGGRMTCWSGQPLSEHGSGRTLAVGDPALLPQAVAALSESSSGIRTK
ncbi:inositol monophosphatase family protein [Granulibacter bethesdensis]|nr:inositol monophosphatase family protein [Granulibacter bethesdensis]